ncbi:uncharacterized protein K489DRAFT_151523 [Dissoconium aciculare CBS 342.82]|jgi:hypothetical protein|uniref:Uncharacterized protein n=1 Tax=Dissoconium aciculare CBS 342.82 TaxID=1314786 RepID=A0A6J3MB26_9PEZI|nr:uncharacterized protein K489DRAFT_151523 [Dissoconium aciculare CBS 342.82]KAF1825215.1 hypothetical protein K489DRAFT_151523 [Dissoconium aciculare CBS 342.82]
MDRFIIEDEVDKQAFPIVFVDIIDDYYSGTSEVSADEDINLESPFIGKSPEECYELLLELHDDTESDIEPSLSVIMDERSTQDDTGLLVPGWRGKDGNLVRGDSPRVFPGFRPCTGVVRSWPQHYGSGCGKG